MILNQKIINFIFLILGCVWIGIGLHSFQIGLGIYFCLFAFLGNEK